MTNASLTHWPNSDVRLDSAHGYTADVDVGVFNSLQEIPLVTAFGVKDNGVILPPPPVPPVVPSIDLEYHWALNCTGRHLESLQSPHLEHVRRYNPTFENGIHIQSNS